MKNLSPLLLANHSVIDELVKALYEDFMVVKDTTGVEHVLFIRRYQGRKVYFDDKGLLLLYQAAIAFFLHTTKQTVSRAIKALEKSGFFAENQGSVNDLLTVIHGQPSKRPVPFYNSHTINVIAARLIKLSPQAIAFLKFREQMLSDYQEVLMGAVVAQAYQQGYAAGLAAHPPTPSDSLALPSVDVSNPTLAEQWSQVVQQVQTLTEQVTDLYDRLALIETNQQTLLTKNEELTRFNHELVTDNLLLHDIRITKERQIAERAAAKRRREDNW